MKPHQPSRRGVTLIEVLVTVAVAVVLTLIMIVGLRSIRGQTLAMKDLHNIRLSGQDMLLWSTENDEKFLNLGPTFGPQWQQVLGPSIPSLNDGAIASFYWAQQGRWNTILWRLTGQAEQHWQSVYGPRNAPTMQTSEGNGSPPPEPVTGTTQYAVQGSRYLYSPTLLTTPAVWSGEIHFPRIADITPFFATVRISLVKNPSSKGLLINTDPPAESTTSSITFIDGSAAGLASESLVAPVSPPPTSTSANAAGTPVIHTLHGYLGRDR